jgi:hypothetical protein
MDVPNTVAKWAFGAENSIIFLVDLGDPLLRLRKDLLADEKSIVSLSGRLVWQIIWDLIFGNYHLADDHISGRLEMSSRNRTWLENPPFTSIMFPARSLHFVQMFFPAKGTLW